MTRPTRGRSLFWSISGLFLLALLLGTLLQALVADAVLRPLEAREARARAELAVAAIASAIATAAEPTHGADLDTLLERQRRLAGIHPSVIVYRTASGAIVTSPPELARRIARELAGAPTAPVPGERGRAPGRVEVIARHAVVHRGAVIGEVQVVRRSRSRPAPGLDPHTWMLFLPIAILSSIVVGLVTVRMLVARLRAIELLAARVAEGDLSVRIADPSGDEIGRLAERLDRMTERLARARAELEANDRQRRQLFADITHELATPLTSIRGNAETLLDPAVPLSEPDRTQYLHGVLDESRRLDRLIRDLFDLARLEAGAATLALERLDWAALCRNTVERFEPRFRKAGLRLRWRGDAGEVWVEADGHRIEQVLENLLVNALRYVPEGGTVEVTLARAAGAAEAFGLVVSDDGPGVPEAELPHVFERFYRGTGSRGRDPAGARGGSGLGLAIVREIVERHGGEVRAEARAPHGLAITVALPVRPPAA